MKTQVAVLVVVAPVTIAGFMQLFTTMPMPLRHAAMATARPTVQAVGIACVLRRGRLCRVSHTVAWVVLPEELQRMKYCDRSGGFPLAPLAVDVS